MRIAIRQLLRKVRPAQLATALAAGLLGLNAAAGPVVAYTEQDGREWMQVTRTRGLSFSSVAAACAGTDGACSGTVNNIDLDSWHFASIVDFKSLLEDAGAAIGAQASITGPHDSHWASALVMGEINGYKGAFYATGGDYFYDSGWFFQTSAELLGYTRDSHPSDASRHNVSFVIDYYWTTSTDIASTSWWPQSASEAGYWLYRDAAVTNNALPLPGTLPLAALALAGLAGLRQRRRRRQPGLARSGSRTPATLNSSRANSARLPHPVLA
ncbi:MAG TPA: hypothetical protein VGE36_02595 [Roseateles sp.]